MDDEKLIKLKQQLQNEEVIKSTYKRKSETRKKRKKLHGKKKDNTPDIDELYYKQKGKI